MKESEKVCAKCQFYGDGFGTCHRFPPSLQPGSDETPRVAFPRVDADEWCGEWKSRRKRC